MIKALNATEFIVRNHLHCNCVPNEVYRMPGWQEVRDITYDSADFWEIKEVAGD